MGHVRNILVLVLLSACIASNRPKVRSFGQQVSALRSIDGRHKPFGVVDRMDLSGGHTYQVGSASGRGQVYVLSASETQLCFRTSREMRGKDKRGESAAQARFAGAARYNFRWLETLDGISGGAAFSQPDPAAAFEVKNVTTQSRKSDGCRRDIDFCDPHHNVITIQFDMCTPIPDFPATANFMVLEVLNPYAREYDEAVVWRLTGSSESQ